MMRDLCSFLFLLLTFCQGGSCVDLDHVSKAALTHHRHLQTDEDTPTAPSSPTSPTSPVAAPPPRAAKRFYRSNTRRLALPVKIPLFGPHLVDGYDDRSDLARDLGEVIKFLCNNIIESNQAIRPRPVRRSRKRSRRSRAPPRAVAARSRASSSSASPSAAGVTDFKTNNQEEGVDEADLVKSDGTHNFAGYGDVLLVWAAQTGELLFNETLPALKPIPRRPRPPRRPRSPRRSPRRSSSRRLRSRRPIRFRRRPRIRSMLLESNRLILFVQGYGPEVRRASGVESSALRNAFDTRIMIYDISRLPSALVLLEQRDIQGSFRDARAIGSNIHVVTTATLNSYLFTRPLRRYDPRYKGLSSAQYKRAAAQVARKEVVPKFTQTVLRDITVNGMPDLSRISLWLSKNTDAVETIFRNGVVNSFVQLTSFDVSTASAGNKLTYSVAGSFTPSSWGHTYAVDGMLVFAMRGWNWIPRVRGTGQTTYFVAFRLDGATASPQAVGSTPGYLLNQFSIDIREDVMRVATTIRQFWPVRPEPRRSGSRRIIWRRRFTTQNQIILLQIPTGSQVELLNEIFRIDNLGKPREVFTAVRFFDKRAYAVTFERTDPLYVVSFDNPRRPKVLGELNITGFSSYLHPINSDNTKLLAVGQEADKRGRVLGVQVTIFDAVDPSNPKLAARFPVELDRDVYSRSAASFDFKAFRYVELREEVGILIMPLTIRSRRRSKVGNFDGFKVFDITGSSIRERLEISHVASNRFYGCYYPARLPQRSLVFSGNVTTLKGHSVIATDLDTGLPRWRFEAPRPTNKRECRFWYR